MDTHFNGKTQRAKRPKSDPWIRLPDSRDFRRVQRAVFTYGMTANTASGLLCIYPETVRFIQSLGVEASYQVYKTKITKVIGGSDDTSNT